FQNLTELEYLHIGGNNLSNFPIEITILTQLNFLHIGNNTISSIPSAFSKLNKLTQVQIQKNNIGYSGIETVDKYFDRSFSYNNQGNISEDSTIFYNQNIIIYVPDSATNNQYQWYKDNSILNNENNRNLSVSEDGTY
ncbi:hypothetical protein, partial [Flammeovirga sp. EKP202]|uniref:hypothetical protein n=1 Tax=Flammeovirga sp. EKP202 TaxID=2770592 RepID=UPI0019BAA35A